MMDEIANVPSRLQTKLLRVLETGEFERVGSSKTRRVDVRIISATNADLDEEVRAGRFRQDLLFRLNTVEIRMPPLRQRREDIPLLAANFLARHAQRYRRPAKRFDQDAMRTLLDHRWPGNVRELSHVVERAVLMSNGEAVKAADLGLRSTGDDTSRDRRDDPRGRRATPHPQSPRALCRQRQRRCERPGAVAQRALPAARKIRPLRLRSLPR